MGERDYVEFEVVEDTYLCQRPLCDCVYCMECWPDRD